MDKSNSLKAFVDWCSANITGDEKSEAQIFLDRFFQAMGHGGCLDVGGKPEFRIRKEIAGKKSTSFADYVWKPHVLIEMKKRGTDLDKYYRQAFDYWIHLVPGRPRYVVLCNFDEFWIYDFENQMDEPVDRLAIQDLPKRYGPVQFLFPDNPKPEFGNDQVALTRQAADLIAAVFNSFIARGVERPIAQRFTLQALVTLFSEDIGLLERRTFQNLLEECKDPTDSWDLIGGLFHEMNQPGETKGGRYKGVGYFNGGVFRHPAQIELNDDELTMLRSAAIFDWAGVRPEIFGTIFEHSMDKDERRAFGAHFTSANDIMKVVNPTIVRPWEYFIENASSQKELFSLHERMQRYTVLDPACGSGNFLYIAYRELKRLEARLFERIGELSKKAIYKDQKFLGFVTARNFYGIDINPFAVELAKITMMMGRKLAIDELHISEAALPLDNLDENFIAGDALISDKNAERQWPSVDVIVGNPPFIGAKRLRPERGDKYVDILRANYPQIPGMADYCTYWFEKANRALVPPTSSNLLCGRAGLVGTQNVRNTESRRASLDRIANTGEIIEAVENQPWSGEAAVHVSIVNWVKTKEAKFLPKKRRLWFQTSLENLVLEGITPKAVEGERYDLSYVELSDINSSLSRGTEVSDAHELNANSDPQTVFQGVTPGYAGFLVDKPFRDSLKPDDRELCKPYLIGRELTAGKSISRYLVDLEGIDLKKSELSHPKLYKYLLEHVYPEVREKYVEEKKEKTSMEKARLEHLDRWWTFWARRLELRRWMSKHSRIIATSRTQRWPFVFEFISTSILPGDKLQLFAFDDDYSFGVLQSSYHCEWYKAKAARLKNEQDYNYSSRAIFHTFPWPQGVSNKHVHAVVDVVKEIQELRATLLEKSSLRDIYSALEQGGKSQLKVLHRKLDEAVCNCYGFSKKESMLEQLLKLNAHLAAEENKNQKIQGPGLPLSVTSTSELISKYMYHL